MMRAMSVRTSIERLCDVCGKPADLYRVTYPPARTRTFDLCERHAAPLNKLDEEVMPKRSGGSSRRVVTQEEVDRIAAKNRAKAKKRPPAK